MQANAVAESSAFALVLINNGADGEDLFRVAATLGGTSEQEEEPKGPENMATVSPQSDINLLGEITVLGIPGPSLITGLWRQAPHQVEH